MDAAEIAGTKRLGCRRGPIFYLLTWTTWHTQRIDWDLSVYHCLFFNFKSFCRHTFLNPPWYYYSTHLINFLHKTEQLYYRVLTFVNEEDSTLCPWFTPWKFWDPSIPLKFGGKNHIDNLFFFFYSKITKMENN